MKTIQKVLLLAVGAITNGIYGYSLVDGDTFLTVSRHFFNADLHFRISWHLLFAILGALSGAIIAIVAIKEKMRLWKTEIDSGNLVWSIFLGAGLGFLFGLFVSSIFLMLFDKSDVDFANTIKSTFCDGGLRAGMAIAIVATAGNAYNAYKQNASRVFNILALSAMIVGGFEGWLRSDSGMFGAIIGVIGGYKITSWIYRNNSKLMIYIDVSILGAIFYSIVSGIVAGLGTALPIVVLLKISGWADYAVAYRAGVGGIVGTVVSSLLVMFCFVCQQTFEKNKKQ